MIDRWISFIHYRVPFYTSLNDSDKIRRFQAMDTFIIYALCRSTAADSQPETSQKHASLEAIEFPYGCSKLVCKLLQLTALRSCFATWVDQTLGQLAMTRRQSPIANERRALERSTPSTTSTSSSDNDFCIGHPFTIHIIASVGHYFARGLPHYYYGRRYSIAVFWPKRFCELFYA